jgi:hypothetical protein
MDFASWFHRDGEFGENGRGTDLSFREGIRPAAREILPFAGTKKVLP